MFPTTQRPNAAPRASTSRRWLFALLALVVAFAQTGRIGHALLCPEHHRGAGHACPGSPGDAHHAHPAPIRQVASDQARSGAGGQQFGPQQVAAAEVGTAEPRPATGVGDDHDGDGGPSAPSEPQDDGHDCPFTTPSLSTEAPAPHPGLTAVEACVAEPARIHAAGVHAPVERLRFAPKHSPPAA